MVFGESPLKDLYRRMVWGPWREALERLPYGWEYRINRTMGEAVARAAVSKRQDVQQNLQRAFPNRTPQQLEQIASKAFATHFVNQYASFAFGRITASNWTRYLRFEGLHHLWEAQQRKKGIVLMHPHMGPAQLPLCVLGALGHRVHQIGGGEPAVEKSEAGKWATEQRHRLEARMPVQLHSGQGYLRGLLRDLQAGEIVLTACDGTGGGQELGRRYDRQVLGQTMRVPVGGWYLAQRGQAQLHWLHTIQDPSDARRHLSVISPPIDLPDLPLQKLLNHGADETAAYLSQTLSAHPGDWLFWDAFHPGGLLL